MSVSVEDVPSPIDFHNADEARQWERDTIHKRPWRVDFFAEFVRQLRQYDSPPHVLELGSGPGHLAEQILSNVPLASYTALDFAQPMHELAKQRLGAHASKVRFVQRDFRRSDWRSDLGSVDVVITLQAAHEVRHKQHQPALLRQIYELLPENGALLFCDHYNSVEPSGKNPALFFARDEQPLILRAAGFSRVSLLLDKGEMTLYRCIK